jgi:hypothetical protein
MPCSKQDDVQGLLMLLLVGKSLKHDDGNVTSQSIMTAKDTNIGRRDRRFAEVKEWALFYWLAAG